MTAMMGHTQSCFFSSRRVRDRERPGVWPIAVLVSVVGTTGLSRRTKGMNQFRIDVPYRKCLRSCLKEVWQEFDCGLIAGRDAICARNIRCDPHKRNG